MTRKIETGSRLGPYEIVAPLGAGGMGEVFRARDTRLDRQVAIKVLPASLADNEQFRARFEREAKTISQLNHPNICTLYDIGHEDGVSYLVMELLEGESLAERLARGPLPMAEVLRYGAQIATALDRAHRAGIVHRDLKPGNVVLTKSGAKLLDFGLAKSSAAGAISIDGATEHKPLTQEGTILGTFQYMSPEQLEGLDADPRTDLFALGAVLYEMATGRRAFDGKTKTSLIAAIVDRDPTPISQIQPLTPLAFEHIVAKCLEKDPEARWQSAHDVAEELRWVGDVGSQAGVAAPVARRRARTRTILTAAVAGIISAAAASVATYFAIESRRTPVRFTIHTPDGLRIVPANAGGAVTVAPDGRSIVFVGQDASGTRRLYQRSLDSFDPKPIPLTEGATYPFWSPDGRAIGFFSGGKLERVDRLGSPPVILADAPDGRGGAWSSKGAILYAPSVGKILMTIPASGGVARPLTRMASGDRGHRFPSCFPDGDHFIYFSQGIAGNQGVWIASFSSQATARLVQSEGAAIVSGDDEILYIRDGVLLSQRLDLRKLAVKGEPHPVAQNVNSSSDRNYQLLSSAAETLTFRTGGRELSTFTFFNRAGKNPGPIGPAGEYGEPSFSGGETKVVSGIGGKSLCSVDLRSGRLSRVTFLDEDYNTSAVASDGSRIIVSATIGGRFSLVEIVPGRPRTVLAQYKKHKYPDYFNSQGDVLLVEGEREDGRGDFDIFVARKSTGFRLETLLDSPANEAHAQLSPDGKFLAYSSDEAGRADVYVQPVPPTGEKWQVSANGGDQGQWRGDGKELFYLAPDGIIMSVPVKSARPFDAGEASPLFPTRIAPASLLGFRNQYLATADGQRFLVLDPVETFHANELSVITNWKH